MDFNFTSKQLSVEENARKFAALEIAPWIDKLENDLILRQEIYQKMARAGYFLMCVPKELGGDYADYFSYILALKAISAVDAGIGVSMSITNMMTEIIAIYGTEEQRKKYFTRIRKGEGLPMSFALTEREAGSDAKNIKTEVIQDPENLDFYILNGSKQFITNEDVSGVVLVLAKSDVQVGSHGISAFLIEHGTEGFNIVKKEQKLGLLSANLIDFDLAQCRISKSQLLGKLGQGFEIAMWALDSGRIGISAQAIGIAEVAYQTALNYAKERYQFGHALSENQIIAFKLADMYTKIEASKGLLYKACWFKERGENVNLAASVAKVFCSEKSIEVVNDALQIHGGYGYIKDYPLERYYRDIRVTTLYEGTSEIQRLIISRQILNHPGFERYPWETKHHAQ